MKELKGYASATAYTEAEKLPAGGYILKILNVEELTYYWGSVLRVDFDIADGEYKDFYRRNYANQNQEDKKWKGSYRLNIPKDDGSEKDNWTMRAFKTAIQAVEDSNSSYHWNWDEKTLVGKTVGGLFRNKEYEYDGKRGFFTECCAFKDTDTIKSGKFTVPADKLLQANTTTDFVPVPNINDDDTPF